MELTCDLRYLLRFIRVIPNARFMFTSLFTFKLQLNLVNNNYLLVAQKSQFQFSFLTLMNRASPIEEKRHESNCVMQIICSILAERLFVISSREIFIELQIENEKARRNNLWIEQEFFIALFSNRRKKEKCLRARTNITQTCLLCWSERTSTFFWGFMGK